MAASIKKLHRDRKVENEAKRLIRAALTDETSPENLKKSLQFALSNFEYHRYLDVNSHQIEKRLERVYEKFAVNSQGRKAERLEALVESFLESLSGSKPGLPKTDAHYAILSVLLNLSETPTASRVRDVVPSIHDENEDFDWTSHLLSGLPPLKRFSDNSSSDGEWSLEEEDGSPNFGQELSQPLDEPDSTGTSSLKELVGSVVNQYWRRDGQVCPQGEAMRIQLHQISSRGLSDPGSGVIREDQLVRETLWLLMTPVDGYVYNVKDGIVSHNPSLCSSHLTEQSLCTLLREFARYGGMLHRLQSFVDSSHGLEDTFSNLMCATSRAFAGAVEDFLQEFRTYVTSLEKMCIRAESIMTLSTLKDSLAPWFHQLSVVHEVFHSCLKLRDASLCSWVHTLISQLEYAISRETQLSNMESASTIVAIWMKTMRPYILFLDHWLTTGILNNSTNEFIYSRNVGITINSDDYWGTSVVLADETDQLPLFLRTIYSYIMEAGKAMELLQAMGFYVEDFASRQPGSALYSDFEERTMRLLCGQCPVNTAPTAIEQMNVPLKTDDLASPLLSEAFKGLCVLEEDVSHSTTSPLPDMSSILPLEVLLDRGLHPLLFDLCSKINGRLLEVLRERHHLSGHLSNLKKYFLLESLHDLYDFYTGLFDDLSTQEFGRDALFENILNWKLHVSLKASSLKDADRLLVIVESKDSLAQGGLFFNALKLNYKASWPVNIVITPACQDQYNQIYQFLLSVKRVKYCLEQINFKASRQEEIAQPLKHQLYLLRYRMLQFINAIHDYLMTRILHTTSHEFKDALSSVNSLDELIATHERYLATITERCLLHPTTRLIREAVVKVLHMAVRFHRKWQHGMHTFSMSQVAAIGKDFSNCSFFLSSTLHKVTKKANLPHLESLSQSIGASHQGVEHSR